ncbi:TPR end-of-group domain-containing protein [Leptospira stimsonii]|uniref:Tetratricopeptide repeat protein n=1 Tax=Leptospira stimsonii TaxID=2202203 RepID=A0ABY2MZI4_9LEPT|nr:hypothetical protein [Leptospira stimsonii]TGK17770.1 hypothetical protein EHO98_13615 [Leptospira stimsonii]TGM12613.1 hypothetical protein EHQ90_15055 [Leptospira stimsonii]
MKLFRTSLLLLLLCILLELNCLSFAQRDRQERWVEAMNGIETVKPEGREEWEKKILLFLKSSSEDSVELRETLRNFILFESARRFHDSLAKKEFEKASWVARIFQETVSFLGIGEATLEGIKSKNVYSAREYFAADLLAFTGQTKNSQFVPLIQRLIPNPITDARLAFNFACLHALNGNKQEMLQYMKIALFLGKETVEFENDSDFNAFRSDPDFIRMLWEGPALDPSLIPREENSK